MSAEPNEPQIRDLFAAMALQGLLSNQTYLNCAAAYSFDQCAYDAYALADAMMKARAK